MSFWSFVGRLALIPLVPIGAIVAWDLFVIIAANQSTPWLWVVRRPHYEVTFSIELPDGVHTAKGVVEAVYFADPTWDQTIPPLPTFGPGQIAGQHLRGEAVTMCLPDGKAISMSLDHQFESIPRKLDTVFVDVPHAISLNLIFFIADDLLTQNHPEAFQTDHGVDGKAERVITAFSADAVSGTYEIPRERIPAMVFFPDGADVHSAHLFNPEHPELWLGPGAKFLGATLSVTNAPVQSDSEKCLPWVKDVASSLHDNTFLKHLWPHPTDNDPIAHEMGRNRVGLGWLGYFLYRSPI